MERQKPAPDAPLLALRCSRASLLLSSLRHRQHRAAPRATALPRSSVADGELRAAGLLRAELAAARREATLHGVTSGVEVLLVLSLVPVLLLLLGLLSAAAMAS